MDSSSSELPSFKEGQGWFKAQGFCPQISTDFHGLFHFPPADFFITQIARIYTDLAALPQFKAQGLRFCPQISTDFHGLFFPSSRFFCHTDSRDLHRFGGFAAGSRLKVQKETNYHEFPTNFLVHTDSTELTDFLIRNKLSLISHKFFLMHNKSGSQAALNSPPS